MCGLVLCVFACVSVLLFLIGHSHQVAVVVKRHKTHASIYIVRFFFLLQNTVFHRLSTPVVIFHPFHHGHAEVFRELASNFGIENTYITTSGKVEPNKSPFTFDDKVKMMECIEGDALFKFLHE